MDDKDVDGAVDWFVNFTSQLADALVAFLDMVPDIVKGGIVFVLLLVWVWGKVK